MTFLLVAINIVIGFIFLYTAASAAVYGVAGIIQWLLHATSPRDAPYMSAGAPALEADEVIRLVAPPLVTGCWLLMAWLLGLGVAP
jgi:hypothetical protein